MKLAFYRMKNNVYMKDCFAVVAKVDDCSLWKLTRDEIIIFIKPCVMAYSEITDIRKLRNASNIFEGCTPVLRVGSECMFGMFGDSHCDCEPERRSMLRLLNERGGVYVHLPQEAQGMGLFYKAQELHLQVSGFLPDGQYVEPLSQNEAAQKLTGNKVIDCREYSIVGELLKALGLLKYTYELVTKNPSKASAARASGIKISRTLDSSTVMTADNLGEYLAKWWQKSYPLTAEDMKRITNMLNSPDVEIPSRAVNLLNEARFTLETDENSILKKIACEDDSSRIAFIEALRNPQNESVRSGGKLQMWSLLERAEAYDEFQYELVLSDKLDQYIAQNCRPEGQVRLWHEKNYYFYPPYVNDSESRDLKIRLTFDMQEQFLAARLIHKIKKANHFYQIRSINFSDPAMFELMRQTVFKDYDQEVIESITYPYVYSDKGIKIIIKRYTDGQRTLSLEGDKKDVIAWKNSAQDVIQQFLQEVIHNKRSFAPEICGTQTEFDRDKFMKEEFMHCRRYFNYE